MKSSVKYNAIGLMSGTSLDGLDMVYCEFTRTTQMWTFLIKAAETIKYNSGWSKKLSRAHLLTGLELQLLDLELGIFIGTHCKQFMAKSKIRKVDFIASHGHTIFHQPENRLTLQIGNGAAIHTVTKIPVINDFRSMDVLQGGQGAPLVPIGDHLLFSEYDVCLNLGGIANLSMRQGTQRIAYDICFVNMGLNHLANELNKKFDKNGGEAAKGQVDKSMLKKLMRVYTPLRKKRPSLGREGFEKYIQPILDNRKVSVQDRLCTFCESICLEISTGIVGPGKKIKLLVTGGGALNKFLITQLQEKVGDKFEIVVPDKSIVEYKEAIVFGFLGVLRIRNEINVLKNVTGGLTDLSAGTLIGF